ncbi:MAG: ABC transporter ATP-binding protein [Clostridium sp.]|uniref:ABC transporter ATP-binding protein n=1 Tax=Clostridium sp. TaxID=1506 RepID=UPI00305ADF4C
MVKKKNIILEFFIEHKISYIMGVIFLLVAAYIQTLFPKILGETIDILEVANFNSGDVRRNIVYMLLISVGTFVTAYIWRNLIIGSGRKLECVIREKLFHHLQLMSPEFYNRRKTGNLIAYAINDINAVRMAFGPATAMSINGVTVSVVAIYSMINTIDWRLTVMCLAPIPIIVIVILMIGKQVQKRFKKVQEYFASISDRVQENIYGIRVIKAYVQEDEEVKNFEELNDEMMKANLDMVRISSILTPIIEICFSISFICNLIIGGNMVIDGTITLGDFIAFNTYLTLIMAPVISIGRIVNVIEKGIASYKRLNEIFKVKPDVINGDEMINSEIKGEIKIKDLDFYYPGSSEKALDGISVTIGKGKTLGIIGKTGSGKTTLASLILRLYNVNQGEIIIDGVDINSYKLESLRDGFGYVPQDNFLFSASVKDNITFFNEDYSIEQVEAVTKESCIYNSITELDKGFDTVLGERGVNLSGGQKQRISIARAIIKNPGVLILDDSLSAVDTITEEQILKNFKNLRVDKSTIIISHKISSIKDADQIIVLDNGKIKEEGTHEKLIKKGGVYYEIYQEQCKDRKSGI